MLLQLAVLVAAAAADCVYTSYPRDLLVYTADVCGAVGHSCIINSSTCAVVNNITLGDESKDLPFFNAVGDLSSSTLANLKMGNKTTLVMKDMKFPTSLKSLVIQNITNIDFTQLKRPFPTSLVTLAVLDSNLDIFPTFFQWPAFVTTITLRKNNLQTIPKGLPPSTRQLAIQNNTLSDFNYLPSNLTFLFVLVALVPKLTVDDRNVRDNMYTHVANQDWTSMTYLQLSYNPITAITNIRVSSKLEFFSCLACAISNFTVDPDTFTALDQLPNSNETEPSVVTSVGFRFDKDFTIDEAACAAAAGHVKYLWVGKSPFNFPVCVVPEQTLAPRSPSTNNTGLIIGCTIGGVAAVAILVIAALIRRRRRTSDLSSFVGEVTGGRNRRANGTGFQTLESSMELAEAGLSVEALRIHKLDLADLKVTASKPLASGAFGEVWLGSYGGEKVAIKRNKDQRVEAVQKFIDEIKLMLLMDSPFIVKCLGVSWRRPIEMEVVVEYMDLGDLRSYLAARRVADFSWKDKFAHIMSIARGLVYLHTFEPPIIHRDLKSRNVLLDSKKGTKLTDFGTSRTAGDDDLMTNGIGTYQWMAPEVITGTEYSLAADIFSFGVILSEFSTHAVPYSDLVNPNTGHAYPQENIMSRVTTGELRPTFETKLTPSWVVELGEQCMTTDPRGRPTALHLTAVLQRVKAKHYK
ncbi:protein kinase [Achlya hypogyna]|uniref:Protein kinase n=1 Tax=Achlya hypogyna TaxID=1202772 RepID=A0A1V9YSP3_ACHHY|nr:protein kinase [Achlya hypogyna]